MKTKTLDPNENLKIEAAQELGLSDKVDKLGWDGLSAKETGTIGALVKKKLNQKTYPRKTQNK